MFTINPFHGVLMERKEKDFLSIASHELKTPITGLKLQAEMAKRAIEKLGPEALSPERVKKIIDNFYNDIDRLKRLVDDMLDVSRLNSGKLSMKLEPVHVDEFMGEVIERMTHNFPNFNKLVNVTINAPVSVRWDSMRIEQVMNNLLSNAFRYGNDSEIKFSTHVEDDKVHFTVRDQGHGISLENQNLIFERFKGCTEKNDNSGLGLGLFIANEIVKAHNGQIHLESTPGQGAAFTVELPLNQTLH